MGESPILPHSWHIVIDQAIHPDDVADDRSKPTRWRVRLRDDDGEVIGAGMLVGGEHVLTCAHVVVGVTLGVPPAAVGAPTVALTADLVGLPDQPSVPARVVPGGWVPPAEGRSGDVALLRLASSPAAGLPRSLTPVAADLRAPGLDLRVPARAQVRSVGPGHARPPNRSEGRVGATGSAGRGPWPDRRGQPWAASDRAGGSVFTLVAQDRNRAICGSDGSSWARSGERPSVVGTPAIPSGAAAAISRAVLNAVRAATAGARRARMKTSTGGPVAGPGRRGGRVTIAGHQRAQEVPGDRAADPPVVPHRHRHLQRSRPGFTGRFTIVKVEGAYSGHRDSGQVLRVPVRWTAHPRRRRSVDAAARKALQGKRGPDAKASSATDRWHLGRAVPRWAWPACGCSAGHGRRV